jgi:hypothetical protein
MSESCLERRAEPSRRWLIVAAPTASILSRRTAPTIRGGRFQQGSRGSLFHRAASCALPLAFVWLLGALIGTPIDAAPFDELEQVFQDKLRAVTPYPDVSLDLNLPKTHPELLSRILRRPLSDFLIVDDELVKAHFEERWNLDRLQLDEYLSVPWFAQRQPDARGGPDHLRLVISSKFTKLGERQGVPTSTWVCAAWSHKTSRCPPR